MSRTKKGKKPPGFDYWGKRGGGMGSAQGFGSAVKKVTKKKERAIDKKLIEKAKKELK